MNIAEALAQAKGMVITDLTVQIVDAAAQIQSGGSGDKAWTRADLTGQDGTGQCSIKWWNPLVNNPQQLIGQQVTISARPNAKNQWFGAKTDVWEKKDGTAEARVSCDGNHLGVAGVTMSPQPQTEVPVVNPPSVQVNQDVSPGSVGLPQPTHPSMPPVPQQTTDDELVNKMLQWMREFELADAKPEFIQSWVSTLAIAYAKKQIVDGGPAQFPGEDGDEFTGFED
jgi:hypothetical protein